MTAAQGSALWGGGPYFFPRAETRPIHDHGEDPISTMRGMAALRDMIVLTRRKAQLSREERLTLCRIDADLRVTQTVNGLQGQPLHDRQIDSCMVRRDLSRRQRSSVGKSSGTDGRPACPR